jgi:nicotinamide riboside transporter PnuC
MFIIPWLLTGIAMAGAIYNSEGSKKGFYYWIISNTGFAVYNACIGELAMAVLFSLYLLITINGIRTWK